MKKNLYTYLAGNEYPGRGICIGRSPDGTKAMIAYWIMGRSANSRNRVFDAIPGGIRTVAADPAKLEDPHLIIYNPVLTLNDTTIVTNGDQTDTIYRYMRDNLFPGYGFEAALATRTFEDDAPNFTPRISGVVDMRRGGYKLSILKSCDGNPASVQRQTFDYPQPVAGEGHFISTYVKNGALAQGIYTNTLPDPELRWEKTGQVNFGLDASLFNNRIHWSLDLYYSKTRDLLLDVPIPVLTGFRSTLTNVGKLENRGVEFLLSTRNIDNGDFLWTTDFNISANRNKVLKLGANNAPIMVTNNDAISKTEVGQPVGNYFGYVFDGVLSQADIDKGIPVYPGSEAGDPKVRDVNKDGKINADDRTIIGNYQPDFTWGMTNNFSYKGFELSIMLSGSQGGEIMNQQARFTKIFNNNRNAYKSVANFWR